MSDEICIHGKTIDEECDPCDALLQESGLMELVDALMEEGVELPDEYDETYSGRSADDLLNGGK